MTQFSEHPSGGVGSRAFWLKWGPLLVLPLSLIFVASAFALKWRSERESAAAVQSGEPVASCCAGHGSQDAAVAFEVPAFSLTERSGKTISREDLKGKVWIASFIYTTCPGPCPIMASRLAALIKELPVRDDLRYVSFSVDPEHDTPDVLARFADRYEADPKRWLFLTGPPEDIHALSKMGFKLAVARASEPGADGPVVHATRFALVDRDGTIRGYYEGLEAAGVARLKQDVLKVLEDEPQ